MTQFTERVLKVIKKIPKGKVSTYGQVAAMAGSPRAARMVGWILHGLTDTHKLPWQRVINSQGRISTTCEEHGPNLQAQLLKRDGVKVTQNREENYFIDLKKYLWVPNIKTQEHKNKGIVLNFNI
jgi:methylated-DNA-protein-cysteine methyltransferase related protein